MIEIRGDLLALAKEGRFDVVVHGCNCYHTMGAGIARQIKTQFPAAYQADLRTPYAAKDKLGTISQASIARDNATCFVVVNGYTQFGFGSNRQEADYTAIRNVMRQVKAEFSGLRIGYPAIGAGLGGGDWGVIARIIDEELIGENHALVLLPR